VAYSAALGSGIPLISITLRGDIRQGWRFNELPVASGNWPDRELTSLRYQFRRDRDER
jgi:hypothetical protein